MTNFYWEKYIFYCFFNLQVMKYPWSVRMIFYPCLNLFFSWNYFDFRENTFFLVSWIFRSWYLRIIFDPSLNSCLNSCFPCKYFPFEEKYISLFLKSPGHELSLILEDHFLSLFKSCLLRGVFNLGNYFPTGENTFFLVSIILTCTMRYCKVELLDIV